MDPARAPRALPWMALAFAAAIAIVAAVAARLGLGRHGAETALRLTGRLAFAFFWPCYAGGALAALFGERLEPVRRRARELGLAFTAVLAVHLCVLARLCQVGHAPGLSTFVLFGAGALFAAALALASIPRLGRALGPRGWWVLRTVGLNWIAFDFALDFIQPLPRLGLAQQAAYLPFAVLALAGPMLRLLAALSTARRWGSLAARHR